MMSFDYRKKSLCEYLSSPAGRVFHLGGHQSFHCALDLYVDRAALPSVAGKIGRYQRSSGNYWWFRSVASVHTSLGRMGINRAAARGVSREPSDNQHRNGHRRARCSNVASLGAAAVSTLTDRMGVPGLRATSEEYEDEWIV
jgi:hypothetical protein